MTYRPQVVTAPNNPGLKVYKQTDDPLDPGDIVWFDTDETTWLYPDNGHDNEDREETCPRVQSIANVIPAQGKLTLAYLTAKRTHSVTKLGIHSGTSSTSTGATNAWMALFTVASNGDLTRVGITANTTTLLQADNTVYETPMTTAVTMTVGVRYAIGFLQVGATNGQYKGIASSVAYYSLTPRMTGRTLGSQTAINASYLAADVAADNTSNMAFFWAAE